MGLVWVALATALVLVAWSCSAAWRIRVGRAGTRQRLSLIEGQQPERFRENDLDDLRRQFQAASCVCVPNILSPAMLVRLREVGESAAPQAVRNVVPTHKQGGTVSYERLHFAAPLCVAFYHSPDTLAWVSRIVGVQVHPAGDHDESACSLLCYTERGDHIGWHYDYNFYLGRQFTLLIVLVDRGATGGRSSSVLMRKHTDGREEALPLEENSLVLFEGTRVLHKVTPASTGDRRIVLSMTFNTHPQIRLPWELARRIKDVAFYGFKALWN